MSNCSGIPNGHYQSCDGCNHFVACHDNILQIQSCADTLLWDNTAKSCVNNSQTCGPEYMGKPSIGLLYVQISYHYRDNSPSRRAIGSDWQTLKVVSVFVWKL